MPCTLRWQSAGQGSSVKSPACTHCYEADLLSRRKLGLLNFSATAGLDPTETLLIYLAAAADPNEQV